MTRFENPFNAGRPADELEDELRELLIRREADITEAARPRTDGDLPVTPVPRWAHRVAELPGGRTGTLLAASVVALLMLGSVFAVRGLTHRDPPAGGPNSPAASSPSATPSPTPSPTRTSLGAGCPLPAKWLAALEAGVVAVDQPLNLPLAAGPDGSFLMEQSTVAFGTPNAPATHRELALFDRDGHGTTLWTAARPELDYVEVSPDSALSTGWAVFGLTRRQNLAAHGVAAWDRAARRLSTVRLLSQTEGDANLGIASAPIVVGDTAYWLEQVWNDPHQTLVSQQLPNGQRHTRPVTGVARLVALGAGVGLVRGEGDRRFLEGVVDTLAAGPGLTVPADVLGAATGKWFKSDGTSLRWLTDQAIVSWRPGQSAVNRIGLDRPLNGDFVGPFANVHTRMEQEEKPVLDTRNGALLRLPPGLAFALVAGDDLITVTGYTQHGGPTVHRVPLTALPATRC